MSCWSIVTHHDELTHCIKKSPYSISVYSIRMYSLFLSVTFYTFCALRNGKCYSPQKCHQLQHVQQTDADSWPTKQKKTGKIPSDVMELNSNWSQMQTFLTVNMLLACNTFECITYVKNNESNSWLAGVHSLRPKFKLC